MITFGLFFGFVVLVGRPLPFSKARWGYEVGRTGCTWPLVREYMHKIPVRHVALE